MISATHTLVAVLVALAFDLSIVPTVFGALLPDVDLKFGLQNYRQERGLFKSHRGITHHAVLIPGLFMFGLFAKDFLNDPMASYLLSFSVGYISHLILDAFNPLGIPYKLGYYPRFSLKVVRTGGRGEIFVILLLVAILSYLLGSKGFSLNVFMGKEISRSWENLMGGLFDEVLH